MTMTMRGAPAVLVTGGAGYIGSHACKQLASRGYLPVTLDNLVYGHRDAVRWGPLIEGDIGDRALLARVFHDYPVRAVMHFAAYAYVGESMEAPGKYFHNNVTNALALCDAMVAHDVKRLIFSSTCATYGEPDYVPIDERHPQRPVNPYGESKLFVEKALRWYEVAYGLRSVSLRYFNAAGADPDGDLGEEHDPETHLIPLVIQAALGQRPDVKIFGTDYPTPDGSAVRDYIHVTDLAEAHALALDYLERDGASVQLNLGTGTGYSVREVIAAVEAAGGANVVCHESPRRAGDPPILVADAAAARRILQWQPRLSDLQTIVTTAWRWHAARAATAALTRNQRTAAAR